MTGVFCLEYKGYQRGTRVKETSRIRKACMCLFDGRKDPVDIYRMHYLRNLFCMHKTKTPSIYADLLQCLSLVVRLQDYSCFILYALLHLKVFLLLH